MPEHEFDVALDDMLLSDALAHIETLPLAERIDPLNDLHDQLARHLDSATSLPLDG